MIRRDRPLVAAPLAVDAAHQLDDGIEVENEASPNPEPPVAVLRSPFVDRASAEQTKMVALHEARRAAHQAALRITEVWDEGSQPYRIVAILDNAVNALTAEIGFLVTYRQYPDLDQATFDAGRVERQQRQAAERRARIAEHQALGSRPLPPDAGGAA